MSEQGAQAIFEELRQKVLSGELPGGSALPSVRELAEQRGINRNTAAAVYKRLVAAGLAMTRGRLGTVVSDQGSPGALEGEASLSWVQAVGGDLSGGNPAQVLLPDPARYLGMAGYNPRLYGCETVHPKLESVAQAWFADVIHDGVQVSVTHGAVDAIERLLMGYVMAGEAVAVEDPCFLGSIHTLKALGMRAVGVEVDTEGLKPEALEAALKSGIRALVYTPRAHNPTGCSISAKRAEVLSKLLAAYADVLLIEDDHFALLADTPCHSIIPPGCAHWARIRSVSKGLGPDLRLAMLVSDRQSAQRLGLRLASGATWVSHILQATVATMLSHDTVREQLTAARDFYRQRRLGLREALEQRGMAILQPCDGLNVWIPLASDANRVAHDLARRGWVVRPGGVFSLQQRQQAIRVTISTLDDERANRFADDLLECMRG